MSAHKKVPRPEGATRAQLVREAKALVKVANDAVRVADTGDKAHMAVSYQGICSNWKEALKDGISYLRVERVSLHWPKSTGFASRPIKEELFCEKWVGMSLANRLDLIAFILNCYAHWLSEPKRKRGAA